MELNIDSLNSCLIYCRMGSNQERREAEDIMNLWGENEGCQYFEMLIHSSYFTFNLFYSAFN